MKEKIKRKINWLKLIKEYAMMILGAACMCVGMYFFVLPCNLVAGGVGGLTNICFYWFNWPTSIVSIALQVPLMVLALILLKLDYAIKTVFSCVAYSMIMRLCETIAPNAPNNPPESTLLWLVFGGVLTGIGIVVAFWAGGSNGGSEIVSGIVLSKNPDYQIGNVLLIFNYCVYALGLVCFVSMDGLSLDTVIRILYSIIMSYVTSFVVDICNHGVDPVLKYYIVTYKAEEVGKEITKVFKRGVTSMEVVNTDGQPTGQQTIMVVIQFRQNAVLKNIIKHVDPDCFAYCKPIDAVLTRPNFNKRYK